MTELDHTEQAARCVEDALTCLGIDISEDLADTPRRWVKAFLEMTAGYSEDPVQILSTVFRSQGADELVILRDISFVSLCEHHLLPFTGRVHVGYLPDMGRVVGLSKLARLVNCYARRLQIQERMTRQIADAIHYNLSEHVGVVVEATHSCMTCRGVNKPEASMVTSSLNGFVRNQPALRQEFLSLISK